MTFPQRHFGRGVRRQPGQMNGWEKRYASYLDGLKLGGLIYGYWFDAVKLRLADNTFYTPDFLVLNVSLEMEIHEVKGHWEDDARVKIKVAADKFPFRFKAVKPVKGEWVEEQF